MLHQCASELRSCVKVEVAVLGLPLPNSPYGLCGRKATLNLNISVHLPLRHLWLMDRVVSEVNLLSPANATKIKMAYIAAHLKASSSPILLYVHRDRTGY